MNFEFSDDHLLLRDQARRFLTNACPPETVRAALEGQPARGEALWQGLVEQGFVGAAIPEEHGGLGAGDLALCIIAEELGRALAPVPFLSSVYLATHLILKAGSAEQRATYLPRLASGELVCCVAVAEGVGHASAGMITARVGGRMLSGAKLPVLDGDRAGIAIVAAQGEGGIGLHLVDLAAPGVSRRTLETIDPTRGQAELVFTAVPAEPLGGAGEGWDLLQQALDRAAVLTAFEQLGGAERALEMARDYALERMAFGRPIGSFQAVKHMLADMYVSVTLARSNAYYGAWALSNGTAELPVAAAAARVSATHAFQHCSRNAIQVHGGIGFTWDANCHLFYRRSSHLAVALGGMSHWEPLLIQRMRDQRRNAVQ